MMQVKCGEGGEEAKIASNCYMECVWREEVETAGVISQLLIMHGCWPTSE